jgi:C-terminal processing protease CtpA/Prc
MGSRGSYYPGVEITTSPTGAVVVSGILRTTQCWNSALRVGDKLTAVDGQSVSNSDEAVRLMEGPINSTTALHTESGVTVLPCASSRCTGGGT